MVKAPSKTAARALRADARLNEARVLEAAREAFARSGFDASYHEVARIAGVGVGTVYRRFPHREVLLEAVLLDIIQDLTTKASDAAQDNDCWEAFARFFVYLSEQTGRHAGLSERLDGRGGALVADARDRLIVEINRLCAKVRAAGLRDDVGTPEIVFLAQSASVERCGLDLEMDEQARRRVLGIILDGLRTPTP